MQGVSLNVYEVPRRRNVVGQPANRSSVASHVIFLPLSDETHEIVALELAVQHLREKVEVRDERSLQNDGDVGRVEQLDGEGLLRTSHLLADELDLNLESLHKNVSTEK